MLRELRIRNFTIIDDLSIGFEPGLNILTGETGAGKSIIVDALNLLLGEKASPDMVKAGKKEASVEAFFDTSGHPQLEELSIESDDGIILRRTLAVQGKGRAYINDTPVSLPTLSAIGRSLVGIHGQHEQQGLLRKESHLFFLDAYAGLQELVSSLQEKYQDVFETRGKAAELKEKARERGQRIEFLKFQVDEIDAARLKPGEQEVLEEERSILLNLSRLKEAAETAYALLYDAESSALEKLSAVATRVKEMAQIDRSAEEPLSTIEAALPLLEDAALLLRRLKDKYDIDPDRLAGLDERLESIKRLEKKYGDSIAEVLRYQDTASAELKTLENIDEHREALEAELAVKERDLLDAAEEVSKRRRSLAGKMETLVLGELHELGFQKASFSVSIKKKDAVTASGIDEVEFLFSANPGEPAKPLGKVASGGELSRIMLALKCIEISGDGRSSGLGMGQQKKKKIPPAPSGRETLIFDEVDAGIGGVTAQHVGNRLKAIAGTYQVLCITHLPQIAALADYHLMVEKTVEKDHTAVIVKHLTGGLRQEELARMLSGRITDGSLKHARELLGTAKSERE
ncbi:MAG: DNA repair protein RecN [Alphaproteobacteria bacterium]|uniref:DNA repair protein RecN n=1 Tax=Candidatus Nitrobium versatile TaxID=2884831 RepID=A0A953J905_9BACT|nr:DNA repair protein RecN [Candidatus Nitrobium versatile]